MPKTVHFKTNTLLKNLIGKDLINDDNIAVVELVKNAYDAHSASVLISFKDLSIEGHTNATSKLTIRDDGTGMDSRDLEDKWLNIAFSDKRASAREEGTAFAGNKGIGRFSCDRLGECLDLLTRKKGGSILHIPLDWKAFEREDQRDLTIQSVDIVVREVTAEKAKELSGLRMPDHGTVLVISRLRSLWDRERILALKKSLEKFLSPNQPFTSRHFEIELAVPDLKQSDSGRDYAEAVNGKVRNQIFRNLQFNSTFIVSEIDEDGKTIKTSLSHEGETVFRVREINRYHLKGVRAYIYYLNPYKKAYFKRQTGIRSVDFGSIFLFLNGFRVAPYGDRGDDWLGLDNRRAQGHARYLGSRELVGRIEVRDDEDSFKPVSSREGLKNTPEFRELREDFALDAVKRLEKFVVDGLDWDSIPARLRDAVRAGEGLDWNKTSEEYVESWDKKKQRIALSMLELIGSSPDRIISLWFNPGLLEGIYERRAEEVAQLINEVEGLNDTQVEPDLRRNLKRLRRLIEQKEQESRDARSEAGRLRVTVAQQSNKIAKLRQTVQIREAQTLFLQSITSIDAKNLLAFHHEIFQHSNIIDNYLAKALNALQKPDGGAGVSQYLERISLANKKIMAIAQFATKANFRASTAKESTDIPTFIAQYITNVAMDFIATGLHVTVKNAVTSPFEIRVRRIELSILIDNILSNAGKAHARNLLVEMHQTEANVLTISFVDDGRGLSSEIDNPDRIFDLGVTTTSGSGLGLYHARQIVTGLGGTISVHPRTTGIEIKVELVK